MSIDIIISNIKNDAEETPERLLLPQNFVMVGEPTLDEKKIYILQNAYNDLHLFTADKTVNESGGFLVGYVIEEFGKTNIVVKGFVEALHTEATPTTLKFTHKTWAAANEVFEKEYPDCRIVGWIHTHPDIGVFLSEYDLFIQKNFFTEDFQIAHVVDPVKKIEGFYYWRQGKIEKSNGFYIYDEVGMTISGLGTVDVFEEQPETKRIPVQSIVIVTLSLASLILIVILLLQADKVKMLETEADSLSSDMALAISQYEERIKELEELNNELLSESSELRHQTVELNIDLEEMMNNISILETEIEKMEEAKEVADANEGDANPTDQDSGNDSIDGEISEIETD